jgi:hypothetical protein
LHVILPDAVLGSSGNMLIDGPDVPRVDPSTDQSLQAGAAGHVACHISTQ